MAPPLSIQASALPAGLVGHVYHATLHAALGTLPYHWQVTKGHLPGVLRLDHSTGTLTGRPTTTGRFTVTVKVTDSTHPT